MFRNALAVSIILLFIGIAVQPSIATVQPESIDVEYSTVNEEVCNCQTVRKSHLILIKSLLNRLEKLDNKLSVISKYNPIVPEVYQELSDRIAKLKDINKVLKSDWKYPVVCTILIILLLIFSNIGGIIYMAYYINPVLYSILLSVLFIISYPIFILILRFDCMYWPPWY
jgi:hypothetical protein